MPVERFRDVADVPRPPSTGDPARDLRAAFELVAVCHRLRPWQPRRGVERRAAPDASSWPGIGGETVDEPA